MGAARPVVDINTTHHPAKWPQGAPIFSLPNQRRNFSIDRWSRSKSPKLISDGTLRFNGVGRSRHRSKMVVLRLGCFKILELIWKFATDFISTNIIDPFDEIEYVRNLDRESTPHFWTWYCTTRLSIIISLSLERESGSFGCDQYRKWVLVLIGGFWLNHSLRPLSAARYSCMSQSTISYYININKLFNRLLSIMNQAMDRNRLRSNPPPAYDYSYMYPVGRWECIDC